MNRFKKRVPPFGTGIAYHRLGDKKETGDNDHGGSFKKVYFNLNQVKKTSKYHFLPFSLKRASITGR